MCIPLSKWFYNPCTYVYIYSIHIYIHIYIYINTWFIIYNWGYPSIYPSNITAYFFHAMVILIHLEVEMHSQVLLAK